MCVLDVVTQVCFNSTGTEIATGAEDGLVCIYDTRHARAEESLQCVLNADCAVRKIGFFAPGGEGVFILTVRVLSLSLRPYGLSMFNFYSSLSFFHRARRLLVYGTSKLLSVSTRRPPM